jgi:hypothetical protein
MEEKVAVVYFEAIAQGYCLNELNLRKPIFELRFIQPCIPDGHQLRVTNTRRRIDTTVFS